MSNIHPFPPVKVPKHGYLIGGPIDSSKVSLRIFGESLLPDSISELLAAKPDIACKKGDQKFRHNQMHIERKGKWILYGAEPEHMHLEKQIITLLDRVTDDLTIWQDLSDNFNIDIHCGVFLEAFNRGLVFSNYLLSELAKRNLKINFDFYSTFE